MYKIVTTPEAIKAAFKEYHKVAIENPEEFTSAFESYGSGEYAELVAKYFIELLENTTN